MPTDLRPNSHPAMRRVRLSFEPFWLGDAKGWGRATIAQAPRPDASVYVILHNYATPARVSTGKIGSPNWLYLETARCELRPK